MMADLVITGMTFAAQRKPEMVKVTEAVAAFDVLYSAGGSGYALASAATAAEADAKLIALLPAAIDAYVPCVPITGDVGLVGPTLVIGDAYYLSATKGKMAPRADLITTGQFLTELFKAQTASVARMRVDFSQITVP